jgi:hypothetical protein
MRDLIKGNCPVVWLGIDFSQARLIGEEGFKDPNTIKHELFENWNHLVITEGDKYNWAEALQVANLGLALYETDSANHRTALRTLITNRSYQLPTEIMDDRVREYGMNGHPEGIGVVIFVESLDKVREQGFCFLTYFDIGTRQVLYRKRLIGKAFGFRIRNYWAGAIYNWLKFTRSRVSKSICKEFKERKHR